MASAQVCLQDLESLSLERDSAKRRELLRKITDLFFMTENQQTESDRAVFGSVMERISSELEAEARAELAERLAVVSFAPHNLVRRLAEDEISVARPVLEASTVLTDHDLVTIAQNQGQDHLMAIARRGSLSTVVTDVIVQRGNDEVLTSVASNQGAKFSTQGFETLAMKSASNPELRAELIEREDVPSSIIETIKRNVAEKLKSECRGRFADIDEAAIDLAVEHRSEKIDFSPLARPTRYTPPEIDVAALFERGVLTEKTMKDYADQGKKGELVHALALLTRIDTNMAYHTLYEAEVPALAVLCKAYHFKKESFAALLQERIRAGTLAGDHVLNALKRYETLSDETAQRILRFLKVRLSVST